MNELFRSPVRIGGNGLIPMPGDNPAPSAGPSSPPAASQPAESFPPASQPLESLPPASQIPASQAPESAAPSAEPAASEPVESAPVESEPVESASVDPTPSAPVSIPPWGWICMGAVLLAAVLGAVLLLGRKRRKKAAQPPQKFTTVQPSGEQTRPAAAAPGQVRIGKLHQQGARSSQQDCFSVSPEDVMSTCGLLAVVADGMGGLSDGDKVSQAAVSAMLNSFFLVQGEPNQVLLTLLKEANRQVNSLLGPDRYSQSGSTLVAGLVRNGAFHYLSVGDSRICLFRDGALYQLNREHVFRHDLEVRAVNGEGELAGASAHPKAAGLTSYLGMGALKYVDLPAQPVAIRAGDKFILMSDGVYNALTEREFTGCLSGTPENAAQALDRAIKAKNYSNQDNYTAVILGF